MILALLWKYWDLSRARKEDGALRKALLPNSLTNSTLYRGHGRVWSASTEMTENSTEIAYQSLESTTAHQDKKTHLIINTNSTARNALSTVFQETWVLHSIPFGRGFVFLFGTQICFLAVLPCSWRRGWRATCPTEAGWQQSSKM